MASYPQTIQIFLPTGDPQGIRVASITTRIVRVLDVPRSALGEFLKMDEADQVGIYFLFGESEESDLPQVYIGQTGSLRARLTTHNQSKEFWTRALIAVSLTNSLTNTHASFLEWLSIQQAAKADRYVLENGNGGARPHTPLPLEAECQEIHETIRVLLATLGYPVFESLTRTSAKPQGQEHMYFCRGSGADGRGLYTPEGFVVLKGSSGRLGSVPSFKAHNYFKHRERLIEQGILSVQDDRVSFERDHLFKSPSLAAVCLLGRAANGWTEWKDAKGYTLDESERLSTTADEASVEA
ncbi:MAG TPA: GIY-YIG nuclease family protein [Rhodanobacteraceae bacterium]